jgi:hypothetical protein
LSEDDYCTLGRELLALFREIDRSIDLDQLDSETAPPMRCLKKADRGSAVIRRVGAGRLSRPRAGRSGRAATICATRAGDKKSGARRAGAQQARGPPIPVAR